MRPDRARSESGGPATYLAAKIQQEGTSKRRKTSKGFYRKTYDYIKAYSPAYDLIREHMNNFLAYDCDVTQQTLEVNQEAVRSVEPPPC